MVKNLLINSGNKLAKKSILHKIIFLLQKDLDFKISSLYINFVSGDSIKKVNKKYLNHNYTTDILTFNYSGNHNELDGEIMISADDAETNSKKYGVSFNEEILRLVIHGILHLLGFNDFNSAEKLEMKRLENKLFVRYKNIIM